MRLQSCRVPPGSGQWRCQFNAQISDQRPASPSDRPAIRERVSPRLTVYAPTAGDLEPFRLAPCGAVVDSIATKVGRRFSAAAADRTVEGVAGPDGIDG